MQDFNLETLISAEQLATRVQQLGQQISQDFKGSRLCIIGVLKGSFVFLADLIRQIDLECDIEFIGVSSYEGMHSTGQLNIQYDLAQNLEGRDVLIVEDIIDTGLTIHQLLKVFASRGPRQLKVCTLLSKPDAHEVKLELSYIGFAISREFVVGYGLDYNGLYRNLSDIKQVMPNAKS